MLPCLGCHTPLPLEATGCQICMRSRTKQEIMRGYAKLREDKARKQRLPFKILAVILILGGGGKLFLTYREKITAAAASTSGKIGRWADDMRDPSHYSGRLPAPSSDAPAPTTAAVAPADPLRTQTFSDNAKPAKGPAPAPGASPAVAARPPAPKPLLKNAWRVTGTIYDLATLAPVPKAHIIFKYEGMPPVEATTDEQGAYEVDLDKKDGWSVSLKAPGHRRGQILDIDPPYRVRDADERHAAFDHLTDGDLIPVQVGWKPTSSRVRLDLVAAPQYWSDTPPPP